MKTILLRVPACRVDRCGRPVVSRKAGLCNRHYIQKQRTGKIGPGRKAGPPRNERPSRRKAAIETLARFDRQFPDGATISDAGLGTFVLSAPRLSRRRWASTIVFSLARRGWIRISDVDERGLRSIALEAAGRKILAAR